ncbi:hypothetical protein SAMN05660653_03170 [Desulfonatronum thiosulfatophilum]|uniref:Uncharacterized protein n=1 Tax=Desulfonatronum thiosulfatophilum TaxID=617002 RepID=A0A1G6EUI7_9BACT|nr:hypothetical protein [Desulfonatronum thiosulfatophilum]SDB61096.1 hypothetical protein SAMN05660653_03170 [Desulfonatronum thiosulfatophilum]
MSTKDDKKALLEKILGSEVVIPTSDIHSHRNAEILSIVSEDLFGGLCRYFNSNAPFFQTSLPLERIVRYKNGSFSSMEKSIKGGFSQHQGFDILNGMDIAQQLMSCVIPLLNHRLTSIYADLINQNNYYLSQVQDQFVIPEISKLKSIAEFIKDVSDEISHISKSNSLCIATLTNIQQRRIDLKQIFHTFIARLEQSVNSSFFDPQNIANSYLVARYSLSNYIVSLVLECIVSGNIDDESVNRLETKVEKCFSELNHITQRLSSILENRKYANSNEINNNSFHRWSYDYMAQNQVNNLQGQNYNIDRIKNETLAYFDIEFEKQRLRDFVSARHGFVKVIKILKNNSGNKA